jgi:hypothetical protein
MSKVYKLTFHLTGYVNGAVGIKTMLASDDRIINECEAVCRMKIAMDKRSSQRKPTPVPLRPPQITRGLTYN